MIRHTVFTPVFNRREKMKALFEKMLHIDYPKNEWEWLIIDDGSTDGIEDLYKTVFCAQKKINIIFLRKKNGGIHSAQNYAIRHAHGKYLTRIDSDDYLLNEALILKDRALAEVNADNDNTIAGVVGLCLNASDRTFRSSVLKEGNVLTTGLKLREKGATGDRNYCIKKDILMEYLIPEFRDTNWVPESPWLWIPIDLKYKTYFINTPLAICEEPNPESVTGQLKQWSLSKMMSSFYYSIGMLNNCRTTCSIVGLLKNQIRITLYGLMSRTFTKCDKIKEARTLLNNQSDKFMLSLLSPVMRVYIMLKRNFMNFI